MSLSYTLRLRIGAFRSFVFRLSLKSEIFDSRFIRPRLILENEVFLFCLDLPWKYKHCVLFLLQIARKMKICF